MAESVDPQPLAESPVLDWVRGLVAQLSPQVAVQPAAGMVAPSRLSGIAATPVVQQPLPPLLQRLGLVPGAPAPYSAGPKITGMRG